MTYRSRKREMKRTAPYERRKPTSTIAKEQATVDYEGRQTVLAAKGRHDPCVLPRAVPIVEAMAALVMADLALCQETRRG